MWKVWYEQYGSNGQVIGRGVCAPEYKRKGYAERTANKLYEIFGDKIKCVISPDNPWGITP